VEQELKDKLSVSRIAEKDNLDIVNLLGILYLKRIPPEEIVNYLGWGERKRLYNLIKGFEGEKFIKENILIEIDKLYIDRLKKLLKKRI